MNDEHPISGLMHTAMDSIRQMVDVNTVVGDAVETKDGTVIIPVSRVSAGFAAGGGDFQQLPAAALQEGQPQPFAGGSGAGVSVNPLGFLVVAADSVRFLAVDDRAVFDRIMDVVPDLVDRLTGQDGGETAAPGTERRPGQDGVERRIEQEIEEELQMT